MRYRLSFIVPMFFRSAFYNQRGNLWSVWWWQWRGRIFRSGGRRSVESVREEPAP